MARARPLVVIGAALALLAGAAIAYLRPPATTPAAHHPPPPFAVEAWRFTATGSGWVAVRGAAAAGGHSSLYATRDGGLSWTRLSLLGISAYVTWLDIFDSDHGVVQLTRDQSDGRTSLLATDDGGRSWRELPLPGRPGVGTPWFLDRGHGWFLTPESLTRTADGGRTWTDLAVAGLPASGGRGPISFVTPERGFLLHTSASLGVDLYATEDGGQTWRRLELPATAGVPGPASLGAVHGFGESAAFAAPRVDYPQNEVSGWVYRSADGRRGWEARPLPDAAGFRVRSVALVNLGEWWMADGGALWVTTDGGARWERRPASLPGRAVLGELQAANGQDAWSAGYASPDANAGAVLLRTIDGGRHWTALAL
jgi:photosystem II stability/assembly factor-like uncharacterized protein